MIELCFDFISPYSYLAWTQARALCERTGHALDPQPVLFAGILAALGTRGPAEVPARRAYVIKDVVRVAHRLGVTLALPPSHPFNPLLALRVAGLDLEPGMRAAIIDALFAATWATGQGIEGPERVGAVLRGLGLDADALLARAAAPEASQRLRARTGAAIERGAFGVPTLFVAGELFFGLDSFPAVEAFCRGEDPAASHPEVARWATLPASSIRRGAGEQRDKT
jgi:2-hydroxychromene-2-carboxylate isomerase